MGNEVFIIIFRNHQMNSFEVLKTKKTENSAIRFCTKFTRDNKEYDLERDSDNKFFWRSTSYNFSLQIIKSKID